MAEVFAVARSRGEGGEFDGGVVQELRHDGQAAADEAGGDFGYAVFLVGGFVSKT